MKHCIVLIASAAALAACNKGPEIHETNASVSDVAEKVREGVASDALLHAGQWRATSTVEEMTIPGLPPQAQSEMKQFVGKGQSTTFEYCLSPEEAKRPGGKFFTGKDEGNCRYERFNMAGGKFDALMHCEGKGPGAMTMAMSGTYSPDSYTTRAEMTVEGGRGRMTFKARNEAKRIGACTGDKDKVKVTYQGGQP